MFRCISLTPQCRSSVYTELYSLFRAISIGSLSTKKCNRTIPSESQLAFLAYLGICLLPSLGAATAKHTL